MENKKLLLLIGGITLVLALITAVIYNKSSGKS